MIKPWISDDQQARYLPWDACYSARELGGYPNRNGSQTRWHALVRADNLYCHSHVGADHRAYLIQEHLTLGIPNYLLKVSLSCRISV